MWLSMALGGMTGTVRWVGYEAANQKFKPTVCAGMSFDSFKSLSSTAAV